MTFADVLAKAVSAEVLSGSDMQVAMAALFGGDVVPEQAAAFLTALRVRGETAAEVLAAVRFLKQKAKMIAAPAGTIDTCGTGGDGAQTYNISTATALVVAGAGVPVAKHGNRAVSSASGSSDVLTELGVNIKEPVEQAEKRLADDGVAFLFAPNHHPVLIEVAGVRKALGFRTLFNMLGPLLNPARAKRQLVGVFAPELGALFADVLLAEGSTDAWIVYGADGLDELSLSGVNQVTQLRDGVVSQFEVMPEDAGLARAPLSAVKGGGPQENAAALTALLAGEKSAYRDSVLFNAAAALVVAREAADLKEGVAKAAASIDTGAAKAKLEQLTKGV
ncbi:MAG: anthranilate phosphoribosyltransferase [Parvularculaceae bacterium]|nr:anthranilate phosphoribosyltransferase [Parvularculaceae bacterium]